MKHLGLGVVGISYREAPTAVRAALLRADSGEGAPSAALLEQHMARGVVRVETCSRVEWLIEADEPGWAVELLRSALLARLAEQMPPGSLPVEGAALKLHTRVDAPAVNYLLRVAAGLDSIAQGEHAVGRQVLKAFERAHKEGTTGRVLNASWRVLGHLLHSLRDVMPERQGIGVQTLVTRALLGNGVVPGDSVLVFGQGDIGRATARSLKRARFDASSVYRRPGLSAFLEDAKTARAVVVCSGAPEAWLSLPARRDGPLLIDVGSPAQVKSAPGWSLFTLDRLLEGLPPARARAVVARVSEFTHRLMREISGPLS